MLTPATAYRLAAISAVLGIFALSSMLLDRFPFREDEAIYSYWALVWRHEDRMFLDVWPDKPPIFLWSLSLVFDLFGPSAAAARWLNIAATTLTVVLAGAIARRQWGWTAGMVTAIVLALNPYTVSFAATAYTDPLLVLFGTSALACAAAKRPFWAGLWLGAAIMTKQQGVLYIPLIVGIGYWAEGRGARGKRETICETQYAIPSRHPSRAHFFLRFPFGLAALILPILFWDSQRWAVAPSPWDLSVRNYSALGVASVTEWSTRLGTWADLLWHLTASGPVWFGALAMMLVAFHRLFSKRHHPYYSVSVNVFVPFLFLWAAAYIVLHLFSTVQTWDRYLLLLTPVLALCSGWLAQHLFRKNLTEHRTSAYKNWIDRKSSTINQLSSWAILCLWFLFLLPPAWAAAQGELPLGGDHGDYAGLNESIAWLKTHAPDDAILYHQQLGWHYRFYLYGRTGKNGFDLRWYPTAIYLADNAAKTAYQTKYLVQPKWAPSGALRRYLPMQGVTLRKEFQSGNFTVYELTTASNLFCDWCMCQPAAQNGAQSQAQKSTLMDGDKRTAWFKQSLRPMQPQAPIEGPHCDNSATDVSNSTTRMSRHGHSGGGVT